MKKFLIASTALTLSAGVAAADVTFSGDARFGVMYNSLPGAADANWGARNNVSKTQLEKRYTLNIDASTTADNGVTFGVRQRIRGEEGAATSGLNNTRLFARYQGFEVAVGNVLGAIETMPSMFSRGTSLTGLSWSSVVTNVDRSGIGSVAAVGNFTGPTGSNQGYYHDWDSFSSAGAGAEGVEVLYSAGDFKGHVSYSNPSLKNVASTNARRLGAYGAYNFNGWTAALGFQNSSNDLQDKAVLSLDGKIQDFGVGIAYAQNGKGADKINKIVVNGSYTMGATTIAAYVASQSETPVAFIAPGGDSVVTAGNTKGTSKTSYGLGASYNLGGGASLVGGIERTTQKSTRADFGVSFRF